MKNLLKMTVLASAVLALGQASSWAAFSSVKTETVSAAATTGGSPVVNFTLAIKDVGATADADPTRAQIGWQSVDPLSAGWVRAEQVIKINSTITNLNGGIQIATDNTNDPVMPFVDPTPSNPNDAVSNPAGLLRFPVDGSTTASDTIPLAWSIKTSTDIPTAADPNDNVVGGAAVDNPDSFQWLYMLDKQTPAIDRNGDGEIDDAAFVNGNTYSTIINEKGIHFGQDTDEFGGGPGNLTSFVYLQSNFGLALPAQTYYTSTITVEAFTE